MDLCSDEKDLLACCGRTRFGEDMASASLFSSLQEAISAARGIWFNKVDVNGCLEAFSANFLIEKHRASFPALYCIHFPDCFALHGDVIKVESEIAGEEQIKITELRIARLFSSSPNGSSKTHNFAPTLEAEKAQG